MGDTVSSVLNKPSGNCLYDLRQYQSTQRIQVIEPELKLNLFGFLPFGWAATQRVSNQARLGLLLHERKKIQPQNVQDRTPNCQNMSV